MTAATHKRCLLVFARNPVAGQVKTRLIPELGAQTAAVVYRQMLQDTLAVAAQVTAHSHELWIDHPDPEQDLSQMAHNQGMSIRVQAGPDLGARMHGALHASLQAADSAVLIGTDCPGRDAPYIEAAFRALQQHDAVLGPAADGGYVLIGLRVPEPTLFAGIPWGSDQVLATTRDRLADLRWSWQELPLQHDVDEPDDLLRFPHLAALARRQPPKQRCT